MPSLTAAARASGLASSPLLTQDFDLGLHRLESISLLRAVEQEARSSLGQHTLMQRAGEAACQWILQALASQPSSPSAVKPSGDPNDPETRTAMPLIAASNRPFLELHDRQTNPALVWCFAGPGNNGGDALCTAAFLRERGIDARVCLPIPPRGEDAQWAHAQAQKAGVPIHSALPPDDDWQKADWLIDGLFGIGLTREIKAPFADIVERLTSRTHQIGRVLALDIPSGLDAETGQVVGDSLAVEASHTLTFMAGKPGLFTGHGRDLVGTTVCARLQIDDAIFERARASLRIASQSTGSTSKSISGSNARPDAGFDNDAVQYADEGKLPDVKTLAARKTQLAWQGIALNAPARFMNAFVRRQPSSHKGTFGSVAIIGGDTGTCGAVILAARAALFTGAGRVHAAMIGDGAPPYDPPHPEIMLRHIDAIALDTMDALAIGPGLGQSSRAHHIVQKVIRLGLPTLIDADALNLVAKHADLAELVRAHGDHIVITPHPGEAARLLSMPTKAIESDRVAAALQLATTFNCTALLKGSGTLIATAEGSVYINATGNSGLSTGGSGDVLSGVLGAFLAQRLAPLDAALAGSYIHGQAAEYLSEYSPETGRGQAEGPAGLTAGELAPAMRHRLNALLREFRRL
jgi:hydroxyethylthiazole kinase-like uncharacterized protein yjeF